MIRFILGVALLAVAGGVHARQSGDSERDKWRKKRAKIIEELRLGSSQEREKEAERRIKAFEKQLRDAKSERERVQAIFLLSEMRHPKILEVLIKLLNGYGDEVTAAAAMEIGDYSDRLGKQGENKTAGEALLEAVKGHLKDKEKKLLKVLFQALGNARYEPSAAVLHEQFWSQDIEAATAAIQAVGSIRSRDSIEPLILMLSQLEQVEMQFATEPPPRNDYETPTTPEELLKDLQRKRVGALLPTVKKSLAAITREKHSRAVDWTKWWKANKATFTVPE